MCVWMSEDDFAELILSFYLQVGSVNQTQVARLAELVPFYAELSCWRCNLQFCSEEAKPSL